MASGAFNLTARLNIQGPFGAKPVIDRLRKELKNVKADIKIGLDSSINSKLQAVHKNLCLVEAKLRSINSLAASTRSSLSGLGTSLNKVSTGAQKTARSQSQVNAVIASTGKGAAQAASEMEEFGRVSGLAIRRFAGFTIATGVIFGLINAIRQATGQAIAFERELVKISQVTGVSVRGLKGLSDEVTRLSTTLGVSSGELLTAARTLSQAGFSATETKKALESLAKTDLAPTFDSITRTTEGAIAALRQFNLEVTDLDSVLGSINAVASKFAVESGDIIGAIRRTGGVFAAASGDDKDAKQSLREFIALFTSVRSTTRESAESIAVGLRTVFTRIQRRTTVNSLKELGIELETLDGKFVGPFEAIKRLSGALKDLDPQDLRFSEIVEELGGFRQIGKVIPLIQQFEKAERALAVATEGQNSLSKDAVVAQQALAVQITKTKESFLALIRDATGTDTFKIIAKSVLFLTNNLISLSGALKPILPLLAAFAIFKGVQSVTQFTRGFRRGVGSGGAGGLGERIGGGGGQQATANTAANTTAVAQNTVSQTAQTGTQRTSTAAQQAAQVAISGNTSALTLNTAALGRVTTVFSAGGIVSGGRGRKKFGGGGNVSGPKRRFAKGGIASQSRVGAAILRPGEYSPQQTKVGKKNYTIVKQGLSKRIANDVRRVQVDGVTSAVVNGANKIAKTPSISSKTSALRLAKSSGLNNLVGEMFEASLSLIQSGNGVFSKVENRNRPFDFTKGLTSNLGNAFNKLKNIKYVEAKASLSATENIPGKIKNQILLEKGSVISGISTEKEIDQKYRSILVRAGLLKNGVAVGGEKGLGKARKLAESFGVSKTARTRVELPLGLGLTGSSRRSGGGTIDEGLIPALTEPQELIFSPEAVRQAGPEALSIFNKTGDPSALGNFDFRGVSMVPGISRGDSFPTDLPSGSFVVRRDSAESLGGGFGKTRRTRFAAGGPVGRFQHGGSIVNSGNQAALKRASQEFVQLGATTSELKSGISALTKAMNRGATEAEARNSATKAARATRRSNVQQGITEQSIQSRLNVPPQGRAASVLQASKSNRGDRQAIIDFERDAAVRRNTTRALGGRPSSTGAPPVNVGSSGGQAGIAQAEASLKKFNLDTKRTSAAMRVYNTAIRNGKSSQDALAAAQSKASKSVASQTRLNKRTGGRFGRRAAKFGGAVQGTGFGIAAFAGGPLIQQVIGTKTAGTAGTGAAISGGLTGGFIGAQLGSSLGPVGAAVGAVGGAVVGAATGFVSAFKATTDELTRAGLSRAIDNFKKTLEDFDLGKASTTEAQGAAKELAKATINRSKFFEEGSSGADIGLLNSTLGALAGKVAIFFGKSEEQVAKRRATVNQKGITGSASLIFSGRDSRLKQDVRVSESRGAEIANENIKGRNEFAAIISKRIQAGAKGSDIFKGLDKSRTEIERIFGGADLKTATKFSFADAATKDREFGKEGKSNLQELLEGQKSIKNLGDAVKAASVSINLMISRMNLLDEAFKIASQAGGSFRSEIASIVGRGDFQQIRTKDITSELGLTDSGVINNRLQRIESFAGSGGVSGELSSLVRDTRTLQTSGVDILKRALADSTLSGPNADFRASQILDSPEFIGAFENPETRKRFIGVISKIADASRQGGPSAINRLRNDPEGVIKQVTGKIGELVIKQESKAQKFVDGVINEFGKSANLYVKKQLEAVAIQERITTLTANREAKLRQITGETFDPKIVIAAFEKNIKDRTGGTLSPTQIAADIQRVQADTILKQQTLQAGAETGLTESASRALVDGIAKNNVENKNLTTALNSLATNVVALAAIEKKIQENQAQREARRNAGRSLVERLAIAQNDPKAAAALVKQITAAVQFGVGGAIAPGELSGGISLFKELAKLLPKDQQKNVLDALNALAKERINLGERDPGLQDIIAKAEGDKAEDAPLIKAFNDASNNQIDAINKQAERVSREAIDIRDASAGAFNAQVKAIKELSVAIGKLRESIDGSDSSGSVLGGRIPGAFAGSKKDSKFIKVQPGEFVVNRLATRDNLGLLENINAGGFIDGGVVDRADKIRKIRLNAGGVKRDFSAIDRAVAGIARVADEKRRVFEEIKLTNINVEKERRRLETQSIQTGESRGDFARRRQLGRARTRSPRRLPVNPDPPRPRPRLTREDRLQQQIAEAQGNPARQGFLQGKIDRRNTFTQGRVNRGAAFQQGKQDRLNDFLQTGAGQPRRRELERRAAGVGGVAGAAGAAGAAGVAGIVSPQAIVAMNTLTIGLNNLAQFATSLNQTAQALQNIAIPEKIQIESAPIQVNVVINGAEAFANMEDSIASLVQDKISRALMNSINPITGETSENFASTA